jgi:peptidoglycan/LPS O-acetylase OafA/YrhL
MNAAHLHLVINHLPIIGAFLSLPLVAMTLWRRGDRGLLLAVALTLGLTGAGALASLQTGDPAEEMVEHLPGVAESLIETHEDPAEVAAGLAVATAVGAMMLFAMAWRRDSPLPSALIATLLLATAATSGAMAWTGKAGGVIRHPEIRGQAVGVTAAITQNGHNEFDADD